jgi:predicted metal-dependent hydrolase
MSSPLALRRAYLHYNRKYFDGKLPRAAEIVWEALPATLLGYQKDDDKIAINDKLKRAWTLWRFTLLHEMCHLKLGHKISHGRRFQDEMRRLANEGAFDGLW